METESFSLSHEKHLSLFLYWAQKLTIFFILFTNMMLSTSLILAVCRTQCHIWTSKWALHSIESLWLSVRASECGIQRSEVQFLVRTHNFFFVSCLWQDEKHLSLYLYPAQKHKCTISLILFTKINLLTQRLSFVCRESSCKSCCSSESAVHGYWCDQSSGPAGLQAR